MQSLISALSEAAKKRIIDYDKIPITLKGLLLTFVKTESMTTFESPESKPNIVMIKRYQIPNIVEFNYVSANLFNLIYSDVPSIPGLTEEMMFKLSQCINIESELRSLATCGLKVEDHIVDNKITNKPEDIPMATLAVLKEWQRKYDDQRRAFVDLCSALGRTNMGYYKTIMLKSD